MSPLLEDSVNEGVPSVQVGVDPSTEAGGVQANPLEWLECPAPELPDSTLNVDLFSVRDSNRISDTLYIRERKMAKSTPFLLKKSTAQLPCFNSPNIIPIVLCDNVRLIRWWCDTNPCGRCCWSWRIDRWGGGGRPPLLQHLIKCGGWSTTATWDDTCVTYTIALLRI